MVKEECVLSANNFGIQFVLKSSKSATNRVFVPSHVLDLCAVDCSIYSNVRGAYVAGCLCLSVFCDCLCAFVVGLLCVLLITFVFHVIMLF